MMSSRHDDQSLRQAAQFHPVLTGILLQHQHCFCIRKASRQMHVLEVPLPLNCQDPKTSSAIRWDGFLSRGSGMDSTGVTRQARLETRSTAGDPITLDLAYSACARGLADRQQGYWQSCNSGQAAMGWHLGPATPLLHKVRAEVDGEQVPT